MTTTIMNNIKKEARRGDIYRDLITGAMVTVESVSKDSVTLDDGRVVSSLVCFKYIDNEAEEIKTEISDFKVEDGVFTYNGEKIITGTLIPKEVIATVPGGVLLTAADNRKNGVVNLYRYLVEKDNFELLYSGVNEYEVLYDDAPVLVISSTNISERQILHDEEEDPETVQGIEQEILLIRDGKIEQNLEGYFGTLADVFEKEYPNKTALVFTSNQVVEERTDVDDNDFLILVDLKDSTAVNEIVVERYYEEEVDEPELTGVSAHMYRHVVEGETKRITLANDANDNRDSLFILTNKGIIHTMNGHHARKAYGEDVVKAAKEYPYCVLLEPGRKVNKFVLANDDYDTATITVTLTDDRGYVTEIK